MNPAPAGARTSRLRQAIDAAAARLAEAGVNTPRADALELAAFAAGVERGRLSFAEVDEDFFDRYAELVAARARRVPVQHLTRTAAFGPVTLEVGPGVFIPRPETEALYEWAAGLDLPARPLIVDVCTGSGALAVALARHRPDARVVAIDDSPEALNYARRNAAGTGVEVLRGDVTDPGLLPELDGTVDLLVANPPYIPAGAELEPEVAQHDPHHALFGGPDGMAIVEAVVELAGRWLRPGGHCGVEHDDTTSARTVAAFERTGRFAAVTARRDLVGRLRFVTATRKVNP
ncbi:peptide chain release factor N(5)-glutamine methyltransferase [uncultured Mycolicibacterium sp.]|uniref:peptide chain release factor N(5)-glutamine methyltransferase n=1 Tax=uncultured Mycolicibacterium sp. TaxID=2320817 RepID=UPI00261D611E|nr:peptide chain release factor N(5)-glutamine methyltransferase [uncultured Mycolicibacterium sp.]